MKIEDQVSTIIQSIKLCELGVSQESAFYWVREKPPVNPDMHLYGHKQQDMPWKLFFGKQSDLSTKKDCIHMEVSAFSVGELGVMMKDIVMPYYIEMYDEFGYKEKDQPRSYQFEAEARAAKLLYCLTDIQPTHLSIVNKRIASYL